MGYHMLDHFDPGMCAISGITPVCYCHASQGISMVVVRECVDRIHSNGWVWKPSHPPSRAIPTTKNVYNLLLSINYISKSYKSNNIKNIKYNKEFI